VGAKGGLNPEVMLAAINAGSGRNSATESKERGCHAYRRKWSASSVRRRAFSLPSRLWTCAFVVARLIFNRRAIDRMGEMGV